MNVTDIGSAMQLSTAEGWNQTETDWKLFLQSPGNICLVAEKDKKVAGTTTAINYSNQIAWIGMVLVAKDYRGQGISKSLLANILEALKFVKTIKLDATAEGQRVYRQFDFKEEYIISRMVATSVKNLAIVHDLSVQLIRSNDINEMIALDEVVFGANRAQLIRSLVNEFPDKAYLLKKDTEATGFALGRIGIKYHHIGPVVAKNMHDAKRLIAKALRDLDNQPVVVDVPADKQDMIRWLNTIGFAGQRDFVRMFRKDNLLPGIRSRQYSICGPEFG